MTRLELSFAVLLLASATGLVLALGMAERRRNFAILTALGAKSNQLGAFLWSERLLILINGGAMGVAIGFGVAQMLLKVLTGVFDPPPEVLSIPWNYLLLLVLAANVSTIVAVSGTQIVSHRVGVEVRRDISVLAVLGSKIQRASRRSSEANAKATTNSIFPLDSSWLEQE